MQSSRKDMTTFMSGITCPILILLITAICLQAYYIRTLRVNLAVYQGLYYDTMKLSESLQGYTGILVEERDQLYQAYKVIETKNRTLSLAQKMVERSGKRCKLEPKRAYEYAQLFVEIGDKKGVPAEVLAAVAAQESCYIPSAKGAAGEIGFMQVLPATGKLYGFSIGELKTLRGNITAGATILADLLSKHSQRSAFLAYNQGHPQETGNPYGDLVMANFKRLERTEKSGANYQ